MKANRKILVVEDEAYTAMSLKLDLEDLGVKVLEPVATGEEAVLTACREKPDLIFMDIRLAGGMDGLDATREIQKQENIPIVFMTGFATDYIRKLAMSLNPLKIVEKPITRKVLEEIILLLDNDEI